MTIIEQNDSQQKRAHFIRQLINDDLAQKKYTNIATRFPPEPNGYLHIGHAKSICLNFGMAEEFSGTCNLRFDDTNPMKEEEEYVNSIIADVKWLGGEWHKLTYASDYYQVLYEFAIELIKAGKAYVDEQSMDQIRMTRGTLTEPGLQSPFRDRAIAENLDLFQRMKAGEFADGTYVLRAKIEMSSPNINMRDPVLYRIRHTEHQRTKNTWCIYPMYDYAHPISDAMEHITHSLCTLEFQDHRPLYDWFIDNLPVPAKPIQTEFARLNLSHTITSKRKLKQLVDEKVVSGWDDPRMPTLCGMRKRGYPASAIHDFCEEIGVSRSDSIIDYSILEECVRERLNQTTLRALCVIDPIKVVIEDMTEEDLEWLNAPLDTRKENPPRRAMPWAKNLYIERADFQINPEPGFHRLKLGGEVRLRHAYIIKCTSFDLDDAGNVTTVYCQRDKATLGKNPEGRKVKGVIQWVSCQHAHQVKLMQYDRLFLDANPARVDDFLQFLNPNSLQIQSAFVEPWLANPDANHVLQFERHGYYAIHERNATGVISYQRVVTLKGSGS